MKFETIIGLEIHAQLATESKMFCSCSTKFGAKPNTNICPICTGQPGVLPKINKKAIEFAIKTAHALGCKVEKQNVFARKNYFYPDLPKGYQVSQYELPLATGGHVEIEINGKKKKIGITRIHLEEDAGKLVHKGAARIMGSEESLVDLNRTGTPLMEIVSEPDIRTPEEAKAYVEELANILKQLGVCDAKLEEGSLRCDANISIRPVGQKEFGTKSEIKNMNSTRGILKGLGAEEKRHRKVIKGGGKIIQETRYFDEKTDSTKSMRSKEHAHDYRYFPEPDLVPVEPDQKWINDITKNVGELPSERKARYEKELKLPSHDADVLTSSKEMSEFFEATLKLYKNAKTISNWLLGDISAYLNDNKITLSKTKLTPELLVETLNAIDSGKISGKIAKEIVPKQLETGKKVEEMGMSQISDEAELVKIIKEVLVSNNKSVQAYKSGKTSAIGFLVGQVMKATKGRANPGVVNKLLKEELSKI